MAPLTADMMRSVQPIGMLRHSMFTDLGPSWLKFDGVTEYGRATYPEFVAKAKGPPWFLEGSTSATFRLIKVPAGTATVASGFDTAAGSLIGSDSVTLLAAHLPEHAHDYQDNQASLKPNVSGLLSSLLATSPGIVTADVKRTTAKAGSANPTPVPIKPPGFVAHLFVFAGRPRG